MRKCSYISKTTSQLVDCYDCYSLTCNLKPMIVMNVYDDNTISIRILIILIGYWYTYILHIRNIIKYLFRKQMYMYVIF